MVTGNYWHAIVGRQIGWAEISFQYILHAKILNGYNVIVGKTSFY